MQDGEHCKSDKKTEKDLLGMVIYQYLSEECDYDYWKKLPNQHFSCDQTKEVPIMIINGMKDPIVYYDGMYNSDIAWKRTQIPATFGPKYFREKYQCGPE